jgi:hypothetical protein
VAGAGVRRAPRNALKRVLDLGNLVLGPGDRVLVALLPKCADAGLVVSEFLAEPFLLALDLAPGYLCIAKLRSFPSAFLAR